MSRIGSQRHKKNIYVYIYMFIYVDLKLNNRYLSMLGSFVFHIVCYWCNDKELH